MRLISNCFVAQQVLGCKNVFFQTKLANLLRLPSICRYSSTNASPQEQKTTETSSTASNQAPAGQPQTEQKPEIDVKQLTEQNLKLTEEVNELKDRYKRALAETENTRVRFNKLVTEAKTFGIQGFCKDLLEVADILNLAIVNTPKEVSTELKVLAKDFTNLHQGLVMTEERMQKIFAKNGLLPIKPKEGDKFDPNFHEALFQAKLPDKPSGTIIQVMKTGYSLHDRVIRAAQVGVAQ